MAEIFNNHSSFNRGFRDKPLIPASAFAGGINYRKMTLIGPNVLSVKYNRSNLKLVGDFSTITLSAIDNLSTLNGLFWIGKNNFLYMNFFDSSIYLKFSQRGINVLKNSRGIQNSIEIAEAKGSGLINGINRIFKTKILKSDWAEYSVFGKGNAEPYTVGSIIRDINLGITTYRDGKYIYDSFSGHIGKNHTKEGVDLLFETIGILPGIGTAYSITYSEIDKHYPGGIQGYAKDIIRFFTDFTDDMPYFLKYVGTGINNAMTELGKSELNNNHYN